MKDKKKFLVIIAAAVLFAALPAIIGAISSECGHPLADKAQTYISARSVMEFAAHISAFTGISWKIFSYVRGAHTLVRRIDGDGFNSFIFEIFRYGLRDVIHERNSGSLSI